MRHALEMFDDLTRETQNGEGPRLQPEALEKFDQPLPRGFDGEKLGVSRFDVKTPNASVRPSIASRRLWSRPKRTILCPHLDDFFVWR